MKKIEVISVDRIGLVGEISKILSRVNGNIIAHSANVAPDSSGVPISHFRADVELDIRTDTEILARRLRKIKNVRRVRITDI
ncbi:ACT domain-containing protein [Ruminococcus sp. YRD2003]|uniref:ACT domain-containing protein n=1 Tax=Ruminococcus sp. YRD2003 TaxID=1452313 RepID=UPI0008B57168|nr:ACT domain-containing protein [Ruminococcus flavefaciens]